VSPKNGLNIYDILNHDSKQSKLYNLGQCMNNHFKLLCYFIFMRNLFIFCLFSISEGCLHLKIKLINTKKYSQFTSGDPQGF